MMTYDSVVCGVAFDFEGDFFQVIAIIPDGIDSEIASCTTNHGMPFRDFGRGEVASLINSGLAVRVEACVHCSSRNVRRVQADPTGAEFVTICGDCHGQYSDTLSRERAYMLVATSGTPRGTMREYPFAFYGGSWVHKGWAIGGVQTQAH